MGMFISFSKCIHSLKKIFTTYNAPSTVQGPGSKAMNYIDMIVALNLFYYFVEKIGKKMG